MIAGRETWRVREKTPLSSPETWTSWSRPGYSSADVSLGRKLLKKSMEICFHRATPVSLQPHLSAWGHC